MGRGWLWTPKWLVLTVVVTLVFSSFIAHGGNAETAYPVSLKYVVGFSFPTCGWIHYNREGRINTLSGVNSRLGYSWRKYFDGGVRLNRFNGFWGWGTFKLIIPYIEFGTTYALPVGVENQLIAIDVGIVYLNPYLAFNIWF